MDEDDEFVHTHARADDPDTSFAAAEDAAPKSRKRAFVILRSYAEGDGLLDEEAVHQAGFDTSGGRRAGQRCSDLRSWGMITRIGVRRPTSSGSSGHVCRITTRGTRWLSSESMDWARLMTVPDQEQRIVGNSELRTFKRCRRKWWLSYVRRLKYRHESPVGAKQLGSRVHIALRQYYVLGGDEGRAAARASLLELHRMECEARPEYIEEINSEHTLAMRVVEGYFEWLEETGSDADLEILSAEHKVTTPSPVEGVLLVGKLDVSVRKISTGDEGFIDHKTVGSLTTPLKTLQLDEQFRMYALMYILRHRAMETGGVNFPHPRFQIYNMLRKVKRTAQAKPPFYGRYEVYISDAELRAFWERLHGEIVLVMHTEQQLIAHPERHRGMAFPTPSRDCSWDCEFLAVCPMFDNDDADPEHVLSERYTNWDPLAHYETDYDDFDEPSDANDTVIT